MISRVFIFFGVFYALFATLIIILSVGVPVNPNCQDKLATQVKPYETPNWLNMVMSAWNLVVNIFTLGLANNCGVPSFLLFVIGLFNVIVWVIGGIGLAFLLRGSS